MSSVQPNLEQLSLKLSEVLEDIGVNDEMIQKRRQCYLYKESVYNMNKLIADEGETVYYFGSQSEGTTTIGMVSDKDMLICMTDGFITVIDNVSKWQIGKMNLLMVRDETTAPGYCLLQLLKGDEPLPAENIHNEMFCIDNKGRVLMKHAIYALSDVRDHFDMVQHGPATTLEGEMKRETDFVIVLYSSEFPVEARQWLIRHNVHGWPNASLKSQCKKTGCFLVPVDSKISRLVGVEWRISTALAERCLMFSLNNSHLKCYVIMKLLLKTNDVFHNVISSYMCKTALLHCIENTNVDFWQDRNLITCLNKLLNELYNCIAHLNCPHFIIPENNLMAGRISPSQQQRLLEVLEQLIKSEGKMLLEVQIVNLGDRLRQKLNILAYSVDFKSRIETQRFITGELTYKSAKSVIAYNKNSRRRNCSCHEITIQQLKLKYKEIRNLYPEFDITRRKAARHVTSLMRTTIGTMMASYSISIQRPIQNAAIEWLKSGLNSDVSSSMLKLATVYYCMGNMNATLDLLIRADLRYDRNVVMPVCGCKDTCLDVKEGFLLAAENRQVTKFKNIVSYCVIFMNHEINIVPSELRQELFWSSVEELRRIFPHVGWMDLAVIDSLPYLYFLQYKTYNSLGQNKEKTDCLRKI